MENYIAALESFDADCQDMYADYQIATFMGATEGFSEKLRNAWAVIKRLAEKFWEWIKGIGSAIFRGFRSVGDFFKKNREVEVTDEQESRLKKIMEGLKKIIPNIRKADEVADEVEYIVDDVNELDDDEAFEEAEEKVQRGFAGVKFLRSIGDIDHFFTGKGNESDMEGIYDYAMESDGSKKRISLAGLWSSVQGAFKACGQSNNHFTQLGKRINDAIAKLSRNPSPDRNDAKRQGLFSRILKILTGAAQVVAGIPGKIISAIKSVFHREKVEVEDWNGPDPV